MDEYIKEPKLVFSLMSAERQAAREEHFKMLHESTECCKRSCNEQLCCSICGDGIGWVYANDLNGSYFNCQNCHDNNLTSVESEETI